MRIVKDTSIDFMSRTFIASCISALLILVGAVSLITNGGPKLSIDFKGGTLVAVNFTEPVDINKIGLHYHLFQLTAKILILAKKRLNILEISLMLQ